MAVSLTHPTPRRDVLLVERGADNRASPRAARDFVEMLRVGTRAGPALAYHTDMNSRSK